MESARRPQGTSAMGTVWLLAPFLLLLWQPGSAAADPSSGDVEEDVTEKFEQGEWISVHDQRWRLTESVRTDNSTRTLELPARKPCGLFVSEERVYVTARGSHELLVFEVSPTARR